MAFVKEMLLLCLTWHLHNSTKVSRNYPLSVVQERVIDIGDGDTYAQGSQLTIQ
jgi:hypothetical protein